MTFIRRNIKVRMSKYGNEMSKSFSFWRFVDSFSNAVNLFSARHAAVLRRPIEALYLDRFAVDPAVNFRQAPKWLASSLSWWIIISRVEEGILFYIKNFE